MTTPSEERTGAGFAVFGLLVGLAAGAVTYAIAEFWVQEPAHVRAPLTVLAASLIFAATYLLMVDRRSYLRAIVPAAAIAAILSGPTWFMLGAVDDNALLSDFPAMFWFLLGAPLAGYLMTTLARAILDDGAPPPYDAVFLHGLTLPLIAAGGALFALLAVILLFAWAALLRNMDVDFFHVLFQKPWFLLPFLGAVGGVSIAMMRGLTYALSALRFVLLLFCRIAMPITAAFSLTFIAVLIVKGPEVILDARFYPGGLMLGLSFVGMLIFNGVYQNGESPPPPAWLRISAIVMLIAFPVYTGLAAYAFWLRVEEYGLTPARISGMAMNGLAALYIVVCLAGVVTELNWNSKKWMPLAAPLNVAMAAIWIVVLIAIATPFVNPWALSARSQEARLAAGKVSASAFDYAFMRFDLGRYGEAALERLARLDAHPEASEIRANVRRVEAAANRWTFENGEPAPAEDAQPANRSETSPALLELPLNPGPDPLHERESPAPQDADLSPESPPE